MEKQINSKLIYQGKILNLRVDEVECANGNISKREVIEHPGGSAIALKDTDGKYFLVKQYRYAHKRETLEFVAGRIDDDENPLEAVKRECIEETGYSAKNIEPLGFIIPTGGYLEERIFMYYGEVDKYLGQNLDDNEDIVLEKYSLEELLHLVNSQKIQDAKTVVMIYKLLFRK